MTLCRAGEDTLWVEKVAVELDRKEFTGGATPNAADSRKYEAVDSER